jgi:hypothetical protein
MPTRVRAIPTTIRLARMVEFNIANVAILSAGVDEGQRRIAAAGHRRAQR